MPDGAGPPALLDRDALARYLSVRPSAIPRLVREGRLPRPTYHLGPRLPRWRVREVDACIAAGLASTDPDQAIHAAAQEIAAGR